MPTTIYFLFFRLLFPMSDFICLNIVSSRSGYKCHLILTGCFVFKSLFLHVAPPGRVG